QNHGDSVSADIAHGIHVHPLITELSAVQLYRITGLLNIKKMQLSSAGNAYCVVQLLGLFM
ncbi:MAG: hypothetical protein WC007_00630, partial [Pelobacteraceae bacterium]